MTTRSSLSEIVKLIGKKRVVISDQFPSGGGLTRLSELRRLFPSLTILGCLHDIDSPWIKDKQFLAAVIKYGTLSYWSLGTRVFLSQLAEKKKGWSPDIANRLGIPKNLIYLIGPDNCETIRSQDTTLTDKIKEILIFEQTWTRKLCELSGIERQEQDFPGNSVFEVFNALAQENSLDGINRYIDIMGTESILENELNPIQNEDLRRHFWKVSRSDFTREKFTYGSDFSPLTHFLFPKGKALFLEEALRGDIIPAFTGAGYLEETMSLRDELFPGTTLSALQITFDLNLKSDVLSLLKEKYLRKVQEQNQKRGAARKTLISPEEVTCLQLQDLQNFWKGRPTTLAEPLIESYGPSVSFLQL